MPKTHNLHRFILKSLILLSISVINMSTYAQVSSDQHSSSMDISLKQFLQKWNGNPDETYYISAFRDLNGDKKSEAIVYLLGNRWCGSGGCNTLILTQHGMSWRIVSNIKITQTPIRVLAKVRHGWHSIGVLVAGGGVIHAYEAELDFNGKSYPTNPSVPPAIKLKKPTGEIVIQSTKGAVPLY